MGIGNDRIGKIEQLLVTETVRSRSLFRFSSERYHPYNYLFEKRVQSMFGSAGALLFPSATLALMAYLKTLDLHQGDEIIMPPLSWVADYSALLFEDINIRFCTFDETLQISAESVSQVITDKTRAVLIPHLLGRGQQHVAEIASICKKKGLLLIEDIAQSFGVKIHGKYAGSFGDFAFSSFNHHKLLSTGDGGVGIVQSAESFSSLCRIHDQGCTISEEGKRIAGRNGYRKGYSLRVSNTLGALALAQLSRLFLIKKEVRDVHKKFIDVLNNKQRKNILPAHEGDIPYTAIFSISTGSNHPSLQESGWHVVSNIPYYNDMKIHAEDVSRIHECEQILTCTKMIGTGFIDPYYALPIGFEMGDDINKEDVQKLIEEIL